MIMPNFVIIGAQKSGTTSLYHYLEQHPQVYMSPVKEPKFFALEGEPFNPEPRGPGGLTRIKGIRDLESYQKLFDGVSNEIAIGEASPVYICTPKAIQRIKFYIPDTKLIAILRHPVDRAYSHYVHWVQRGLEPFNANFMDVWRSEEQRIRDNWSLNYYYKQRGFYCQQLSAYYEQFDPQKIRVFLYEDLRSNPINLAQDIFRFLGVDDSFIPDISEKYNISKLPNNQTLHQMLTKPNPIRSFLRPLFPKAMRQQIKSFLKEKNKTKPQLDPQIRAQLIQDYKDDILKLQDLIQRDLSHWLSVDR